MIVLLGLAAVGVGIYLATQKKDAAPGGSSATQAAGEVPKGAEAVHLAVQTAQALPANTTTVAPGGTQVSKSAQGTVLFEPGFELEGEGCSDAAGGPISCDDLAARLRSFNDSSITGIKF